MQRIHQKPALLIICHISDFMRIAFHLNLRKRKAGNTTFASNQEMSETQEMHQMQEELGMQEKQKVQELLGIQEMK